MSTITVQDIKRDPQGFLTRIEAGEALVVMRDEQPMAEVHPVNPPGKQPRPFGLCAGMFTLPADFNQPLPEEVIEEFEGK